MGGGHEVVRDNEEESLKLIDRWAMDALIPGEKELAILMRWEGRLTRACPEPSLPRGVEGNSASTSSTSST